MGSSGQLSLRTSRGRPALLLWVALRLPLLLAAIYMLREPLVAVIETRIGIVWVTAVTVNLLSTSADRVALFSLAVVVLSLGFPLVAAAIRSKVWVSLARMGLAFGLFLGIFYLSAGMLVPLDVVMAIALSMLLVYNTLPSAASWRGGDQRLTSSRNLIFTICIGVEVLLPKPFLVWLASLLGEDHVAVRLGRRWMPNWFPGVCVASALAVLFLSASTWSLRMPIYPQGLLELRRAWFPDPSVDLLDDEDAYWLELSADRSTLYVSGWGTPHLLAYNVKLPSAPPRASTVDIDGAEYFAYDPAANELFVFIARTSELVVLDASTLALQRSFSIPALAEGEVTVIWDARSGQVFLLSEADIESGPAFTAVDAATGDVNHSMDLDAGSGGLLDPNRPVLYLAFFRRRAELVVYDTEQLEILKTVATEPRIDGLAFDERADQLLVGSPLNSAVLRYDAETLERKGDLKTSFGVRGLALDPERNLLLSASIATNHLDVIDLTTDRVVARYWVGPWLRRISLDTEAGIAYVSSKYGLFKVDYTDRLPATIDPM